ncbi:MAG: hypothetical protein Q7R40_09540 [Phaeospirillum sp.]|nr:hypothetical protein [Phaeospirillum sp.]
MEPDWIDLGRRLREATGADTALDLALSAAFGQTAAPFTASVDASRALVAAALPGWRLHLGYDVSGMFPYASLSKDGARVVSDAPTVPLAVLRSAVAAKACPAPSLPPPA